MEQILDFAKVARLKNYNTTYSELESSYICCHVHPGNPTLSAILSSSPLKLGGTLLVLFNKCKGLVLEINQEEFEISDNTLMLCTPLTSLRAIGEIPADVDAFILFSDVKFSQSITVSLTSVALPPVVTKPKPVRQISEEESLLLKQYFALLQQNASPNTHLQIGKLIAGSLFSALIYQIVQFFHKSLDKELAPNTTIRRHDYVRDFIKLVHLNYVRERSVAFYAERLFISPKYLSLLVKEATGRSAAKWIDDFVIMEAKNLLRFSGKNIQQVAYALNFPTQSSFGKYFKHLTGLSPTEFQKS